jgi:dTDP-4-amino-4,6-dideoxygalactose transaminase
VPFGLRLVAPGPGTLQCHLSSGGSGLSHRGARDSSPRGEVATESAGQVVSLVPEPARFQRIPFNRPSLCGSEMSYMAQAVANGQISGGGRFTSECEQLISDVLGAGRVFLTTSCTHALEMCALLLGVCPGDEVILPTFTFVSTVNAFVLRGATPVFCDIRADTLNLDESLVPGAITPKTKAIVAVHYAGVGCEMDALCALSSSHSVDLIEDNAHGLFGSYKGRMLGTFGSLATQSFHETKNVTCGEGGAIVVNRPELVDRAEVLREKGTNRSQYFRGQVDKYSWVDIGSSYVISELLAAFLLAQLEQRAAIQTRRRVAWLGYDDALRDWARNEGIRQPIIPSHCEQSYHLYYLIMPSVEDRGRFIIHMRERGILSVFHYLPLHLSPMGRRYGGFVGQCPVAEHAADRLVRLPLYNDMSEYDHAAVVEAATSFRCG